MFFSLCRLRRVRGAAAVPMVYSSQQKECADSQADAVEHSVSTERELEDSGVEGIMLTFL